MSAGSKQTCAEQGVMSAKGQKQTFSSEKQKPPSRGSLLNFWLFGAAHYFV